MRAKGERDVAQQDVYGDFTYLDDGTGAAFQWVGYPTGGACTPSCNTGYLGSGDYLLPATGTLTRLTPLLTWKPLAGKQSYFVIVSKDANFSNIVDYAFTHVPAYSPRSLIKPTTYSDETTLYYWAVLPATGFNGGGAVGDPLMAAASNFQKQSIPPSQLSPDDGALATTQPVFRWTPVEGARRYRFQVAQEPTFAAPLEDVPTASTSYTPFATYPADTTLYWRVRADDENLIGLNWSSVRTLQRKLPTPTTDPSNPTIGDFTPAWKWSNVTGSSGYTFSMDGPDGRPQGVVGRPRSVRRLRLPLRAGHLALARARGLPEVSVGHRFRAVVGVRTVHEDARRAERRPHELLRKPHPALLELEARRDRLPGADLHDAGLLDDDRGRHDRQHELCAADDASVLRERRIALLARRRTRQELQRRRLLADAADRHRAAPPRRGQPPCAPQALEPSDGDGAEPVAEAGGGRDREGVGRGHQGPEGQDERQGQGLVQDQAPQEGPPHVQGDEGWIHGRVADDARVVAPYNRAMERAVHDRGAWPTDAPIDRTEHELDDWELLTDALVHSLASEGLMNVDELRRGIESMPPDAYEQASYYERWLYSIETILTEKGVLAAGELDARLET